MTVIRRTPGSRDFPFYSEREADSASTDSPWRLARVPNGFWDIRENRVRYMDWLAVQCGIKKPADWYEIRKRHFVQYCGGGLLRNHYGCSIRIAAVDYLPDYDWKPWLFGCVPNGYWKNPKNRNLYMHWLAEQLGFTCTEDWYGVTAETFHRYHGGGLLNNNFQGSVQGVMNDFLPDFKWHEWQFCSVPQKFWQQPNNRRRYMLWLGQSLGFQAPADWKSLTHQNFTDNAGASLLYGFYRGSMQKAMAEIRDDHVVTVC